MLPYFGACLKRRCSWHLDLYNQWSPQLAKLDSTTEWFERNLADLEMHTWRFAGPGLALWISISHVVAASGCSSVYRPPRNDAVRRLGAILGAVRVRTTISLDDASCRMNRSLPSKIQISTNT